MRLFLFIVLTLLLNFSFAKEILFEKPVNLYENNPEIKELFQKHINDVEIENLIKDELRKDYAVVSLDECIDIALKNNFDLQISEHNYRSSKYEYENALSKFLPILHTTVYIADNRGQMLVGRILRETFHETVFSANITAEHELTQGGKQIFEAKAAKYFARSQRHNYYYNISQTILHCAVFYYKTLLAKLEIELCFKNLAARNLQLNLAKQTANLNKEKEINISRLENKCFQAKTNLISAIKNFCIYQTNLADIMGIEINTPLMPFENKLALIKLIDENKSPKELLNLALDYREDLKSQEMMIKYEKAIKNVYVTDFIPKPMINYQEQFQGTFGTTIRPNYIITGYLTWMPGENLGIGTITKIKAQKEKINVKILEYQAKLNEIEKEITQAYEKCKFYKKESESIKNCIKFSANFLDQALQRFNKEDGSVSDIIDAQNEYINSKKEYLKNIVEYNIAQLNLMYNVGLINKDTIKENYNP